MNKKIVRKTIVITATDRVGRTESITLKLGEDAADRLEKASKETYPDGSPNPRLVDELNEMYEMCEMQKMYGFSCTYFSKSQFYKLRNFFHLIYHKFYNYGVSIDCK